MPVPNPRTWEIGETVTAALMNQEIRDAFSFLLDAPRVKVSRASAFSVPNQDATLVPWDQEILKSGITHSTLTNSQRLTVVDPGLYLVVATVTFDAADGGQRRLDLCFNGDVLTTREFCSENMDPVPSPVPSTLSAGGQMRGAAGDWFMARVYQSSGASINISTDSSLSAVWMGR